MAKIPVSEPSIGTGEREYVNRCLESGWISSAGEFLPRFEAGCAERFGRRYGVAVSSGTAALITALRALHLPGGSEVILPAFTIISCALACVYNDLVPVFVDAESQTWNMNVDSVEASVGPDTRAVMAVHIYGHPVDMDPLQKIADRHDLVVVEDFAEAMGSTYRGRPCGGFGRVSCTSFYANKVITTGEGGMCLTDDEVLAEQIRRIQNLCFLPDRRFVHEEMGFNFRLTNLQAAMGVAQLEKFEDHVEKKRWLGETYKRLLGDMESEGRLVLPAEKPWARNSYWMFGVLLPETCAVDAAAVRAILQREGIQTRPFFFPLHRQPAFKKFGWFREQTLPVAEDLYRRGFYLPSGLTLDEAGVRRVAVTLRRVLDGLR